MRKVLFFVSLLFVFLSCSQVSPELNFSTGSIIFDYDDETTSPDTRLAVFVDISSDEHRAEIIKVESLSYGYEWETSSPLKFENGNRKYTGYTNFVMPNSELFPQGQYKVTYIDANEELAESTLNLAYSQDIYEMKADDAASYISSVSGMEYWAAYDQYDILIYYGQKANEMASIETVWRKYPNAVFVRSVWVSSGSRTICIMPKIYKNTKDSADSNESGERNEESKHE